MNRAAWLALDDRDRRLVLAELEAYVRGAERGVEYGQRFGIPGEVERLERRSAAFRAAIAALSEER